MSLTHVSFSPIKLAGGWQQLPEPATLPWREITEIWLIRVVVALAAILEHEFCSRSQLSGVFLHFFKNTICAKFI